MARNSRLSVCLATVTRNSSNSHWQRSMIRQRTTPWIAGIGPLSMMAASAARCAPLSRGAWPGALRSMRPSGPPEFELQHPVANDLQRHAADLGRLRPRGAVIDRRQRQKPSSLRAVLGPLRRRSRRLRVKISPKRDGHGEPPSFAMLNHCAADLESTPESRSPRPGISRQ